MNKPDNIVTGVNELLGRASKVLIHLRNSDEREDSAVEAAYRLLKAYVTGHEVAAKSANYKSWLVSTRGSGFFNGCLYRVFEQAIEFRDWIKDGESVSELYAVALGIIRDYETYRAE